MSIIKEVPGTKQSVSVVKVTSIEESRQVVAWLTANGAAVLCATDAVVKYVL